jgi:hypothetical protein
LLLEPYVEVYLDILHLSSFSVLWSVKLTVVPIGLNLRFSPLFLPPALSSGF